MHVYVLAPDGSAVGGLDIGSALDQDKITAFLEQVAAKLHVTPGPPAIRPHPQSAPPKADDSSLVFHLVARGNNSGSWREFPAENWIVLSAAEWKQFLPPNGAAPKTSWDVPPPVAKRLYEWFYPQTEDSNRVNRSTIEQQSMRMTMVTVENEMARARVDGTLRMRHPFYPGRDTRETVEATITGFMDFDVQQGRIQRLRIITDKAIYNGEGFGAAARSVSRETLDALAQ